jgi:hypothetical protein
VSGPEGIVAVVFFGGGFWVLRPLVAALAKRIGGGTARAREPEELVARRDALADELHQVRQEIADLAERVDFTERLLAKQREAERLAPPR